VPAYPHAVDITDVIEVTAFNLLTCRALGVAPSVLPEDIVKSLRESGIWMA
jgi:hypothetical protein